MFTPILTKWPPEELAALDAVVAQTGLTRAAAIRAGARLFVKMNCAHTVAGPEGECQVCGSQVG